jgi:pimeloyl-ACP methyl ester carboxylesterase
MTAQGGAKTIVLIHGLWMNAESWELWVERYESRGYRVIASSWPGMDRPVAELREDTSAFDDLSIGEILEHYTTLIAGLDEPPIIMGHSFGGVFTQVLLDRGLGSAGVAIDSGPVKGLLALPASTLKAGFPVLKNPANRHRAVALTASEFHYSFTNTLDEAASQTVYERYAVPGPGHVLFEGALANFKPHAATTVDFGNDKRAPLLFIAGGEDHVAPAKLNAANAKAYRRSTAITAYKEFAGRSHFTLGQEGWEEVADYALSWAENAAKTPATADAA